MSTITTRFKFKKFKKECFQRVNQKVILSQAFSQDLATHGLGWPYTNTDSGQFVYGIPMIINILQFEDYIFKDVERGNKEKP